VRRTDGGGCNLQQSALFRLPVAVYALLALRLMCAWCVKCSCCRNWNKTLSHSWLAMKNYWRRKCTCAACGGKRQQPDDDIEDWLDAKLLHVEHAKKKMVRVLLKMATAEHTSAEHSIAQNSAEQYRYYHQVPPRACLPYLSRRRDCLLAGRIDLTDPRCWLDTTSVCIVGVASLSLSLARARWTDTLQKGRSKYEINKFFYSMADTHMRDIYDEVQHYHFRKRGIDRTLVRWAFAVGAENAFCSAVCIQSVLFTKTHSGQTLENLRKRRRFFPCSGPPCALGVVGRCENRLCFVLKTVILPSQARDKHRETS
jgi:hypothetical protein